MKKAQRCRGRTQKVVGKVLTCTLVKPTLLKNILIQNHMSFSRLFGAARTALQIPLVRHITAGAGVTWSSQEVMSIAGSVWIESEKIKSESTDEEEPKFKHYRLIAEQAFRDSGFKNPIYIRFIQTTNTGFFRKIWHQVEDKVMQHQIHSKRH